MIAQDDAEPRPGMLDRKEDVVDGHEIVVKEAVDRVVDERNEGEDE